MGLIFFNERKLIQELISQRRNLELHGHGTVNYTSIPNYRPGWHQLR